MHIADIDNIANNGNSLFHRAHPVLKLVLALVILFAFISSYNLIFLGTLFAFVILLYLIARVPLVRIGHLALYPAFFSLVFALIMSQGNLEIAGVIIIRAIGAALSLIFLFSTTPYIDLFSYLSKFMPAILGDVFLFTYRGFFILLRKSRVLVQVVRMRGGFRLKFLIYDLKNIAAVIGLLLVESFSISERMYAAFVLRGYEGNLPKPDYRGYWIKEDIMVLLFLILVFAWTVIKHWMVWM